jgi:hypothetical protein
LKIVIFRHKGHSHKGLNKESQSQYNFPSLLLLFPRQLTWLTGDWSLGWSRGEGLSLPQRRGTEPRRDLGSLRISAGGIWRVGDLGLETHVVLLPRILSLVQFYGHTNSSMHNRHLLFLRVSWWRRRSGMSGGLSAIHGVLGVVESLIFLPVSGRHCTLSVLETH